MEVITYATETQTPSLTHSSRVRELKNTEAWVQYSALEQRADLVGRRRS